MAIIRRGNARFTGAYNHQGRYLEYKIIVYDAIKKYAHKDSQIISVTYIADMIRDDESLLSRFDKRDQPLPILKRIVSQNFRRSFNADKVAKKNKTSRSYVLPVTVGELMCEVADGETANGR